MLADVGVYGEPGFIRLQCRVTLSQAFPAGSVSQTKPGPGVFIISFLAAGFFFRAFIRTFIRMFAWMVNRESC